MDASSINRHARMTRDLISESLHVVQARLEHLLQNSKRWAKAIQMLGKEVSQNGICRFEQCMAREQHAQAGIQLESIFHFLPFRF